MDLTPAILQRCMPQAPRAACEVYAPAIWNAAVEFGQSEPNRLAAMLASAANESGQLTRFEEMSWHSTPWARAVGMFAHAPSQADYEAWQALPQWEFDQLFFDQVYGQMMGNKGEGYKYRGLGLGQITGHDNCAAISPVINVDLVADPEQMLDPVIGSRAFAAYLKINRITDPAVDGTEAGFLWSVRRSNPGLAESEFHTHHLARWREVRRGLELGVDLRTVQGHLLAAGFDPQGIDGIMGKDTRAALEAYQRAHSLPVTGSPDAATLAALGLVTGIRGLA